MQMTSLRWRTTHSLSSKQKLVYYSEGKYLPSLPNPSTKKKRADIVKAVGLWLNFIIFHYRRNINDRIQTARKQP